MTKVLVVYEMVPEETRVYVLDLEGTELEDVLACSGLYAGDSANSDEEEARTERMGQRLEGLTRAEAPARGVPLGIPACGLLVLTGFLL